MAARRKNLEPAPGPEDSEALDYPQPADGEFNLENLLTSDWGFGLSKATAVQRAICRVVEGRPLAELACDPNVLEAFGGVLPEVEGVPLMCVIMWAIRGAKSMISAGKAICLSQQPFGIDLSPGDTVRIPILSLDLAAAKLTFAHLVGGIMNSPYLRSLMIGKPTADSLTMRHPTGREVEICVRALSRAGATVVGCWMPGAIFDEAPRMGSDADYVRSLSESLDAMQGRIMPGGTIMLPGSPHKPVGTIFEMHEKYFGRPCADCIVIKAKGWHVNPSWWTPQRCERMKALNPRLYNRDVLAEFDDGEDSLFGYRSVDAAMRADAPSERRSGFSAALFPASHRNAWTLLVIESWEHAGRDMFAVPLAREWEPDVSWPELAAALRPFDVQHVTCPEKTSRSVLDAADEAGVLLVPEDIERGDLLEQANELKVLLATGRLFLPADAKLRADLLRAQLVATPDGNSAIRFPETGDGRRCDYAPLLVRALKCAAPPPDAETPPKDDLAAELERLENRNADGAFLNAIHGVSGY